MCIVLRWILIRPSGVPFVFSLVLFLEEYQYLLRRLFGRLATSEVEDRLVTSLKEAKFRFIVVHGLILNRQGMQLRVDFDLHGRR